LISLVVEEAPEVRPLVCVDVDPGDISAQHELVDQT
jgi:hypothetical protein